MTDNNEPENSTISHNIEALPFADLPYEFKERLAQLLPRGVLATLARTGHEAALLAFPHIRFVKQLRVSAQSQSPYLKISINKTHFVDYDVKTETREFYITRKLTLNLHSRRAFNKVCKRVHGPYRMIIYDCDLSLHHLIKMLDYPTLRKIYIDTRIPLHSLRRFLKFCQWLDSNSQKERPVKLRIKESQQGSYNMVNLAPVVLGNRYVKWI